MKLYSAPNTCSLSPHIVLRELGIPFELVIVNNKTKNTSTGENFLDVNPRGYVAALKLDDGRVLTEGPAIVQYIADLRPEGRLAPPNGSWERSKLQEWLNFITSEIHTGSVPLFNTWLPEEVQKHFKDRLFRRFRELSITLDAQPYLVDGQFSVADAYLFAVMRWMKVFSIDLRDWPPIAAFMDRMDARPAVRAAIEAESAAPKPA